MYALLFFSGTKIKGLLNGYEISEFYGISHYYVSFLLFKVTLICYLKCLFSREIRSPDVRQLRTAVSSFMDLLHLVTKTVNQFGPPVQQSKKVRV